VDEVSQRGSTAMTGEKSQTELEKIHDRMEATTRIIKDFGYEPENISAKEFYDWDDRRDTLR